MRKKITFISGIFGQDGAYLAKFLIKKDIIFLMERDKTQAVVFRDLKHQELKKK